MKFEVDVFWVKAGGIDPVDLLGNTEGRVSQIHLKDLKSGIALPEFGSLRRRLQGARRRRHPDGAHHRGGRDAGVAHAHVEQDQSPDPLASIRQSMDLSEGSLTVPQSRTR